VLVVAAVVVVVAVVVAVAVVVVAEMVSNSGHRHPWQVEGSIVFGSWNRASVRQGQAWRLRISDLSTFSSLVLDGIG
jgi:hypothetical protein